MTSTFSLPGINTDNEQDRKRRKYGDSERRPENDDFHTNRFPNNSQIMSGSKNISKDYANVTDGEGDSESPEVKENPCPTPITSASTSLFSNGGPTMMLSDNHASQGDRDPVHQPIQEEEDHCFDVNIPRHHPSSSSSISITINDEDLRHHHRYTTTIPLSTSHSHSTQDGNGDVNNITTVTTTTTSVCRSTTSDHDVSFPIMVSTHTTHNDNNDNVVGVVNDDDDDDDNDVVVGVDNVDDDVDADNDNDNNRLSTTISQPTTRELSLSSALSHHDLDCEVRRSCRIRRIQLAQIPVQQLAQVPVQQLAQVPVQQLAQIPGQQLAQMSVPSVLPIAVKDGKDGVDGSVSGDSVNIGKTSSIFDYHYFHYSY